MNINSLFKFRTPRIFTYEDDYITALDTIERLKKYCKTYIIHECYNEHPANAFDSLSLAQEKGEKYINNTHLIFFDAANALLSLNKQLSGEYGWFKICDVISTVSGIGVNNQKWTLHSYRLKPEYAEILIEKLSVLESEINTNYMRYITQKREKEKVDTLQKDKIRSAIKSIETTFKTIKDEGGQTKQFIHRITLLDGETLIFSERNVFDVGIVINSMYNIIPNLEQKGLCINENNKFVWKYFDDTKGWRSVRELTENERAAILYIIEFGGFCRNKIRI